MDPRLLRLYQDELTHLREVGKEFALDFPKIAARLGMEGIEVADPYVERLLEGFAFLSARVQLKISAEQPRLIAQLLESIYPNFLSPVPSMAVLRFGADPADPNLTRGHRVPRHSAVHSGIARGQDTSVEFQTAMAVTLWPVEISSVQYFTLAPDLSATRLPQLRAMKGGLRIRLRTGGGLKFNELGIAALPFYINAPDDVAFRLHELVAGASLGSLVVSPTAQGPDLQWREADSVRPLGLSADEALLPESLRAFSGHRMIQEVAALPQRLLFFEIGDLKERLARVAGDQVELLLLFSRPDANLEPLVDDDSLALYCTPAINLFRKRLDRVELDAGGWEYHLVPDRTRPMDYEVHSVETLNGHGAGGDLQREFRPLYHHHHELPAEGNGYFTTRREPRILSARQRSQGPRSGYVGEEVFIALVDAQHGPYRESLRQLAVGAWVTNRDLPTLLPQAGADGSSAWELDTPGPVSLVECLRGPTRPVSRQPQGEIGWQLVSQLTQNHLQLAGSPEVAAAALRDTLRLYGPPGDRAWSQMVDGVLTLRVEPVIRRLPFKGPLSFGHGMAVTVEVDELAFQGSSAFLLGQVMENHFTRHAAINGFVQFTLRSQQRGEIKAWPPHIGQRQTL